ncbi:MFS transporter [Tichowtungia aerotolerans]|uniref:MFS transporter n=1 Tax=Tichowtungia aerotolerans TaxID=2697043 RepID=A0A6P1M1W5_9BACT|nr:MFS transporter [Tichowtungia aerotolerans]QHI68102.1 MFS transporter [Tichowtungia aerotolerans]
MKNDKRDAFIETLYNRVTGEEDTRVCKDIPESACKDQPHNFFAYLGSNLLGKVADEIASAKLIIPWLFGMLGVPAIFTGFLVPIREGGVLLPQLLVAAAVRKMAIRKKVWIVGALLSAISLFGMAAAALSAKGASAGGAILLMLILFSLSRGLCSVSAKDVLGKTVSKSRRGALMGWSSGLSGIAVLLIGLWLGTVDLETAGPHVFFGLLITSGILWIIASLIFSAITEQPGATEGGGNALKVAMQQLKLLKTDAPFRRFVTARGLLLSVALAPPFYVLIAQSQTEGGLLGLGSLIIANGLAASLSAPFWGYMGDRSSKQVMAIAATGSGLLGIFTFIAVMNHWQWAINAYGMAVIFLILNVMHGGVRLGRKVYLVDMATGDNRAAYVAISNTVIGVLMLFGGLIGLIGDWLGPAATVLVLGALSILSVFYIKHLPDVSEPS